jgi:hypothetical protein
MAFVGPDGRPIAERAIDGADTTVSTVTPEWLGVIAVPGPDPIRIETAEGVIELEPGADYLVVLKESYIRMHAELANFKDWERRTLSYLQRRCRRRT